jgi:hypothetical protein
MNSVTGKGEVDKTMQTLLQTDMNKVTVRRTSLLGKGTRCLTIISF